MRNSNSKNIHSMGRKTLGAYLTGLVLSLLFTLLAFAIVGWHWFDARGMYIAVSLLAILQLIAQVTYFLRLNGSREGQWNLLPFLFTIVIIVVILAGSLWIMYNLNFFMDH